MSTKMFVCRIARSTVTGLQFLTFIGPSIDHIPAGWSWTSRRVS